MAEENEFYDAAGLEESGGMTDSVAQRAEAYRRLMGDVSRLPRGAGDLRSEGLLMLRAVRMSFRCAPQGEVGVVCAFPTSEARL